MIGSTQINLTLVVIIALFFIYYRSDKSEKYIVIKLIGFYLLGAFRFNFNTTAIPLGFIIYILALRPKTNINPKRAAAILGLFIFLLGVWIPKYKNYLFSRTIEVTTGAANLFNHDMERDWTTIKANLNLEDAKLQNLDVQFKLDGTVSSLRYQLIAEKDGDNVIYDVYYPKSLTTYTILPAKTPKNFHVSNTTSANAFFNLIGNINLKEIMPKGKYDWGNLTVDGKIARVDSKYKEALLLTGQGIKPMPDQEKPIQGVSLVIFGMTVESDGHSSSTAVQQYILTWQE